MTNNPVEVLPEHIMSCIWDQLGPGRYRYVAPVHSTWKEESYCTRNHKDSSTYLSNVVERMACVNLYLDEIKISRTKLLQLIFHAAAGNHLDVLCNIHERVWKKNHTRDRLPNTYWSKIQSKAAKHGHLRILEWTVENGGSNALKADATEIFVCAARNGHIHILEWAESKGMGWWKGTWLCYEVAIEGNFKVLKWLHECKCPWDEWTTAALARNGHLRELQWVRRLGCPWDGSVCCWAAEGGHLNVLQWARSEGCPWGKEILNAAARNGHLEVLQWALDNGCPCDENKFLGAAVLRGHLHVLQWARAEGCMWDESICTTAAQYGHLTLLQWAVNNGCPFDAKRCLHLARKNARLEVEKWIGSQE